MKEFRPTFLYIKQHNITGIKYFGKTVQKDPTSYKGSGTYWLRHLAKYGTDVTTVWYQLFTDQDELVKFALDFSHKNNIVESKEWANLKPEDGMWGGGVKGAKITPHSEEHKRKISESVIKRLEEKGYIKKEKVPKEKVPKGGWKWSQESTDKLSEQRLGRTPWNKGKKIGSIKDRRKQCQHCGGIFAPYTFNRWHDIKCKVLLLDRNR